MIELDIRTLSLIAVLISCLMAGVMTVVWRLNLNERSAYYWALGNVAIASGFLFLALRGILPSLISIPVANSAITLGYSMLLVGISVFLGHPVRWWLVVVSVATVFLSFLYFTYVTPLIGVRIVIISLLISALSLLAAYQLFKDSVPHMRVVQRLTGLVFLVHAAYLTFRALVTLFQEPVKSLFSGSLIQSLAFLDVIVVAICLTFGFSAMINRRLQFYLDHLARYDTLTQVHNRRAFEEAVVRELARSRRKETPLSILLLDIDHFKQVNDQYGHTAGDSVLKELAAVIRTVLRSEDVLGRIGGEEFALLLPETKLDEALDISERIRKAIAAVNVEFADQQVGITVSIGVAAQSDLVGNWDDLFVYADQALYRAKQAGRNRVMS